MTAQIGDNILWKGEKLWLMGELGVPSGAPGVVPSDDHSMMHTACWRGYVATWEVRDDRLLLVGLRGRLALPGEPLPADWISGVLRVAAGPVQGYVHMDYFSSYEAVIELDVRAGEVQRWRRLEVPRRTEEEADSIWSEGGISPSTPAWEWLPEWGAAFGGAPCGAESRASEPGAPHADTFRQQAMRARLRAERGRRCLRYGELAKRAGLPPSKGGRIAEFERGDRHLDDGTLAALSAALDISRDEQKALRAVDNAAFEAAWDAWADTHVRPSLIVAGATPIGRAHRYLAPEAISGDAGAVEAWAVACARLSWRSILLCASRRSRVRLDSDGRESSRWHITSGGIES